MYAGILVKNRSSTRHTVQLIRRLVTRELRARYVGSVMGLFWSVIHPIVTLVVYTYLFSYILNIRFVEEGGVSSFALYLFCGLLPFLSFQETVSRCTTSLTDNANLVRNLTFPAKTIQFSIGIAAVVTQLIGLAILFLGILLVAHQVAYLIPLVLPLIFFLFLFSVGVGLITCTLHVYFRDTAQVVAVMLMVWLYLTPIFYPAHIIPNHLQFIVYLNPLAYTANIYRHILLQNGIPSLDGFVIFVLISSLTFLLGYWIFTRNFGRLIDEL